ncbi:hypothetical protein HXX76_010310 [Chlamydomonas incerta]|uniref:Septin-type G domain-containing protein n=1 Tax=Chlamydomonas incerta TaxID=51695 RepID=A0A835VZ06_CHLIN|nr:hypothetical protein HXX76_010310 [Chlamydomonas incerta]|eukprot:KAG2430211.1 hypothetical protein HXX76_010310 [Chlamydomonas incerta]
MPSADMMAAHQALGAGRVESVGADSVCAPAAFSLSGRASSDASAASSLGELGLGPSSAAAPSKHLHAGERHVFFNILVAGQSKLGKSRFIASLADTFGMDEATKRPARSSSSGLGAAGRPAAITLDRHARELQTHLAPLALPGQPGRQLHTMLQDTQGHSGENNKTVHLAKLLEHLLRQREADYRGARSGSGSGEPELPHSLSLCLYFLPPTEVSALDLAFMSALAAEVPLLPVLVPQPDAPEQDGGGPVPAERLAALRRSLVAAMAGYTRDGKAAPIVPLALDPEAVDALLQHQEEEGDGQAQEHARRASASGENGARTRRRGSASSLSVLVLGDGASGSLARPDAALLRRLLDCSVEPVLRSAAERFSDFCERYDMYGNDVMFMLSERMEPYGKAIRAAEAADAEAAARRQQEAAAAAAKDAKAAAHAVAEAAVINVIVRDASHTVAEHAVSNVIARDAAHTVAEHAVSNVLARDAAHTVAEHAVSNVIARDAAHTVAEHAVSNVIARDAAHTVAGHAVSNVIARDAAHTVAEHAVSNVIARDAAHTVAEHAVSNVIARDAAHTVAEHAVSNVIARDAAHTVAERVTKAVIASAAQQEHPTAPGHATKRGHDSLQGSAADTDAEDAHRHAARPRAVVAPAAHLASPFTAFATDGSAAAARSSTPRFAAPPATATADAFAAPLPPSPEPEHDGAHGEGDVERVVSAIEEIVTQLSRSLEASGSDGEHSARASPRGASAGAISVGAPFGALTEGEEEGVDAQMEEAEEVAGGADWADGAVVAEAAVVAEELGEMHAAPEEEAEQGQEPVAAAGGAKLVSAGSGGVGGLLSSMRRYWSARSSDGSAPHTGADSSSAAAAEPAAAGAGATSSASGAWPAAVSRYVPTSATSAAVGVGLVGLAAGTAAVMLLQRSRSAAMTA